MRFTGAVGVMLSGLSAARGRRVRMRTGTRAVEEVRLGDEVLCVDPETGERVVARVSAIRSSRRDSSLVR